MNDDYPTVPAYDPRLLCPNCGDKTEITEGYGIIGGGGPGPYTLCNTCGDLISKSVEMEDEHGPEDKSSTPKDD